MALSVTQSKASLSASVAGGQPLAASRRISPMSCPRGVKRLCELCGGPAFIQCACGVTFYCGKPHQDRDSEGIHSKICSLMPALRSDAPIVGTEAERAERIAALKTSKVAIIDLCRNEASKFLVKQQYELAIPGAMQALKICLDVFGDGSMEVIPAYLLLAQANFGLARYHQAEEYLSMANWSVVKLTKCPNSVKSQLHRAFGNLFACQDQFEKALHHFARDIYYCSLDVGPENVAASGAYFQMASVFFKQSKVDCALAFFDKVVDIWYKFLVGCKAGTEDFGILSEADVQQGLSMLKHVYETRDQFLGSSHIATGEAQYILALLYSQCGDLSSAKASASNALEVYKEHLGVEHPSTVDVQRLLTQTVEAVLAQQIASTTDLSRSRASLQTPAH